MGSGYSVTLSCLYMVEEFPEPADIIYSVKKFIKGKCLFKTVLNQLMNRLITCVMIVDMHPILSIH